MNIVTRIAPATRRNPVSALEAAQAVAARLGVLRAELWNQYGGLQAWGKDAYGLIQAFKVANPPEKYGVDFKGWERTAMTVMDDIHMTHAAIRAAVEQKIAARWGHDPDRVERLKSLDFLSDPVLHRWVREAMGRGHTQVDHHIVLTHNSGATFHRRGKVTEIVFNGARLPGTRHYQKIALSFRTGLVNLDGYATIIFKDGQPFLHYPYTEGCQACARREKDIANALKAKTRACGCRARRKADKKYRCLDCASRREHAKRHAEHARQECPNCKNRQARTAARYRPDPERSQQAIGVDKGFTEAFACSDGTFVGEGFGRVLSAFHDRRTRQNAERAKLRQRFQDTGNDQIRQNNLGCQKITRQKARFQARMRQIAGQAANALCRQHAVVVAEDLSRAIRGKDRGARRNRLGALWQKGTLREALDAAAARFGTTIIMVNPAYTSQVDSRTNLLLGKRNGDRFIGFDGVVMQADTNAARAIRARASDPAITVQTPYQEVKRILWERTVAFCKANGIELPRTGGNTRRNEKRARGAAPGGKNARRRAFRANQAITASHLRQFVANKVG